MFLRGRGRLHWEKDIDKATQRMFTNEIDEAAQKEFLDANRERLIAEAKVLRDSAKAEIPKNGTLPMSNASWLEFLDQNPELVEKWRKEPRGKHRELGRRLMPFSDEMPPSERLQPSHLEPDFLYVTSRICGSPDGFFLFVKEGAYKHVFFACSIGSEAWGMIAEYPARRILMDFSVSFCSSCRPIPAVLRDLDDVDVEDAGQLYRVDVELVSSLMLKVTWLVKGLVVAQPPRRRAAADSEQNENNADDNDSGEDSAFVDSDIASAYSEVDEAILKVPEESDSAEHESDKDANEHELEVKPEDEEVPEIASWKRVKRGTHWAWSNPYFYLIDHPSYDDNKIRIHDRWCTPSEMQRVPQMSNAQQVIKFDSDRNNPIITQVVLRSWMIWRFQQHGFSARTAFRANWLAQETQSLKEDIAAFGIHGGGTGCEKADDLIRRWVPDCL